MAAIAPVSLLDLDIATDVRVERRTSSKEGNRQYNVLVVELENGYTIEHMMFDRAENKLMELLVAPKEVK